VTYPVDAQLEAPLTIARWRPFVHWLLVMPHLFVATILGQVAGLLSVVSWFVIVFTGEQPDGIARFQVMVLRYEERVASYAFWLREPYPKFEFPSDSADDRSDPMRIDVRPPLQDRNRLTVGLRFLWIIPAAFFAWLVFLAAAFVGFAAFFVVLFTGRWSIGMRMFVIGAIRVAVRLNAYGRLVVDEYPPFDLGEDRATPPPTTLPATPPPADPPPTAV
jgi:hypothetical protein